MRLSTLPLLSATFWALPSCSAPTMEAARSMQVFPDKWVRYDLEVPFGGNSSSTQLERRQNVDICQAIITTAACIGLGKNLFDFVNYVANAMKDASNSKSCGTFTGSAYGVAYRYQANGRNCDTTAEQVTIAGALENHIKTVNNGKLCNTECLDLTHGGTWDGYLLIGPANNFDSSIYCGPSLSFSHCSNGGKHDLQ